MHKVMPAPKVEELVEAIERAGQRCLSYGIGSADGRLRRHDQRLERRGGLRGGRARRTPAGARLPWPAGRGGPAEHRAEDAFAKGYLTGKGSGMLRVGPVKFFTDGSAGGRTAGMSQALHGDGQTLGVLDVQPTRARRVWWATTITAASRWRCTPSATPRSTRSSAPSTRRCADGTRGHRRHRIEHCGFLNERQMGEMQRRRPLSPRRSRSSCYDFGDLYYSVLGADDRRRPIRCAPGSTRTSSPRRRPMRRCATPIRSRTSTPC